MRRRSLGSWLLVLAVGAVLELLVWRVLHRSQDELRAAAQSPDAKRSLYALHVLANRGDTLALGSDRLESLLAAQDPVARDFALTWDFARSLGIERQKAWLKEASAADAARGRFFLSHNFEVQRPKLELFRRYLEARGASSAGERTDPAARPSGRAGD